MVPISGLYKPLLFHWNGQRIKRQSARTSFLEDFSVTPHKTGILSRNASPTTVNNVNFVCIINDKGKGWDVAGLLAGTPIRSNCIVKKSMILANLMKRFQEKSEFARI
jgi:hypothetical protein